LTSFDLTGKEIAKVSAGAIQSVRNARHYLRTHVGAPDCGQGSAGAKY
jgi:hypothetical protein